LTANALNAAFGHLLNDPSADYDGPVLGDIGGYREKILDEIGSVTTDVLTQLAAPGPPLRGRSGANPTPPTTGFGIAPAAMIETNTTLNLAAASVDDNPNSNSNVPTAIAGVAMSLAFSLGGLQFLSQRRAVKLPPPR
jgi:hypothetical protein